MECRGAEAGYTARLFGVSPRVEKTADLALSRCGEQFRLIERVARRNQQRMLRAFTGNRADTACLSGTTGYGYSDRGRETLEKICAEVFGCESALLRHNFMSGTHTLAVALFGVLRPGDRVLCVTGRPYDTLLGVIGEERSAPGSLKEFGISFDTLDLLLDGGVDLGEMKRRLSETRYKAVYIQRSRGYTLRPSLGVAEIGEICREAKRVSPDIITIVDNCYGEFVEETEPTAAGADLIAGSLIKNPGGGLAPTGGYIAGRADLVEMCANRLTAPGVGGEIGATLEQNRELYLGFYNAPHAVGEALKTAVFAAALFGELGFPVTPRYDERRADIVQTVLLGDGERLSAFCRGVQRGSPIDSYVTPEAWDMPGYGCRVIMAAGAFTAGSSIELSADAPLREPYAVWMQGGTQFDAAMAGVMLAADEVLKTEDAG